MLALVAFSVVNAPVPGVVEPMAGGEAKNDEKPAPLTAPDAERVVKAPELAVVAPMEVLLIPLLAERVVNAPVDGVVLPIGVPLIDPPVILAEAGLYAVPTLYVPVDGSYITWMRFGVAE